jgi:hypothetical protein
MAWDWFHPERVAERVRRSGTPPGLPSPGRSVLEGAVGFTIASLIVFATVAFAERRMYRALGLAGAYAAWTLLFVALGGGLLSRLVIGPGRWPRFLAVFAAAFSLYAVGWTGAYFTLRGAAGEWVGSFAGSILMALVLALSFGSARSFTYLAALLFASNTAGYFLGAAVFSVLPGAAGMLLWGIIYGLALGAGLGAALYLAQAPVRERLKGIG